MQVRTFITRLVAVAALVTTVAGVAQAQEDRLRVFGSLNAGIGKVDNIPVQGLTKEGTTDYRILALQFRFLQDNVEWHRQSLAK